MAQQFPRQSRESRGRKRHRAKVYPYDPENAMKWIQTLPQGPDRIKALETIYQGLPKDSDEAEAFASEFGLGK